MRVSWMARFLNSMEKPLLKIKELEFINMITEKDSVIREKDSHIKTVELMLHSNEERHVEDMKQVNHKLDIIVSAYEKQGNDLIKITEELVWQREEALTWRERLATKMEIEKEKLGVSPPSTLLEIEKLRKSRQKNDKKGLTKT